MDDAAGLVFGDLDMPDPAHRPELPSSLRPVGLGNDQEVLGHGVLTIAVGTIGPVAEALEWWPDYGSGPLWKKSGRGGEHVDASSLGLPTELVARLTAWNASYTADKLPLGGDGDSAWISQGIELLAKVRRHLSGRFEIIAAEPWWQRAQDKWPDRWLVAPVDGILRQVPDGSAVPLDLCHQLADGIDMVFRTEVAAQYPGWPPGSTTDGALVDICVRSGARSLEVVGRMFINFDNGVFPFRALIERAESSISLDGFIGQVDDKTGHPPRLLGAVIIPVREDNQSSPRLELIAGHRQSPIEWTKVLSWSRATAR
jgi:hypothetical protein